jgi:hypothetical protein
MLGIQALAKHAVSGTEDERVRPLPILERLLSSSKLRARKLLARNGWVTLIIDRQAEESEGRGHNFSRPVG